MHVARDFYIHNSKTNEFEEVKMKDEKQDIYT